MKTPAKKPDRWLIRNLAGLAIALVAGIVALVLTTKLKGGVDQSMLVSHIFVGVFADRGVIMEHDPNVTYLEQNGRQFLTVEVPHVSAATTLSILVPSAVRCVAGSLSPVAGLQGARIPIIIANPRSFGLSRFYFASLPALPDRPSQAICEITNPAWHKNRIERWLSIGILDGARGGFGVRFPPDKIGAREITSSWICS